jgi:hypothetical protein
MYMQEAYYKKPLKDVIYIKGSAYEFSNEVAGKTTYDVYKNRILKVNIDLDQSGVSDASAIADKLSNGESVKPREISKKLIGKTNKYETLEKGEKLNTIEVGEDETITKSIENNEKQSDKAPSYA